MLELSERSSSRTWSYTSLDNGTFRSAPYYASSDNGSFRSQSTARGSRLGAGTEARLRALEGYDDDEVDDTIPSTWGAGAASETASTSGFSSVSNPFASTKSRSPPRTFARAFATPEEKRDPYDHNPRGYSFARNQPTTDRGTWTTIDQTGERRWDEKATKARSERGGMSSVEGSVRSAMNDDLAPNDPRNSSLAAIFGEDTIQDIPSSKAIEQV